MSTKGVRAVLEGAIYLLEEHGWTQDQFRSQTGCYCLVGALAAAAGSEDGVPSKLSQYRYTNWLNPTYNAIKEHLDGESLIRWNDIEQRSSEEVIELLKTTLEGLDRDADAS